MTAKLVGNGFGPTEPQAAEAISFTRQQPGQFSGWHAAPRRQYVISIAGEVEIVTGDGTSMRFKAGDVLLAEDLTGHGHTTRVLGDSMRVSAMVPLRD
jgi:quercetin dioxygenase-like cupin family protein